MFVSQFRHFTPTRGTFQETFFNQERFVYLFDCSGIFTQSGGNGSKSYRTTLELIDNGTEDLVVHFIQSVFVDIQCFK